MDSEPDDEDNDVSVPLLWVLGILFFIIIVGGVLLQQDQQELCEERGGVFIPVYRGTSECVEKDEINRD